MNKKSDPKDEIEMVETPDNATVDMAEESDQAATEINDDELELETAVDDPDDAKDADIDETKISEVAPAAVPERNSKSGVVPLLFGGFVAALFGFFVARTSVLDDFIPPSWRSGAGEAELLEQIRSTQSQVANLNGKLSEISDQISKSNDADVSFDEGIETQLTDLLNRIAVLESVEPAETANSPDFDGYFAELKEIAQRQHDEINALLAKTRAAEENSQSEAINTLARAAASRIDAAITNGEPFAVALEELKATGLTEIPPALENAAEHGVGTLGMLQDAFPDAARAALSASRSDDGGGISAFLKRQLGARSVEPREGSDPDAILSRVEEAVRTGNLSEALLEAETLPATAISPLSEWLENTKTRLAVETASETLIKRLSAN